MWKWFLVFAVLPSVLSAAEPGMTFKGKLWLKYSQLSDQNKSPDRGFDVYRGFLTSKYRFDSHWSSLLTLDAKTTDAKTRLIHSRKDKDSVELFTAYIERQSILGQDAFRFGLQPNYYTALLHGLTESRWLAQTLAHEAGYLAAMNAGAGYEISLFANISLATQLHDGASGFGKRLEQGESGNINLIWRGESFTAIYQWESARENAQEDVTVTGSRLSHGAIVYRSDRIKIAGEYLLRRQDDGRVSEGGGLTVNMRGQRDLGLFARYFSGNNDLRKDLGAKSILTIGPTFQVTPRLNSGVVYEKRTALTNSAVDLIAYSVIFAAEF